MFIREITKCFRSLWYSFLFISSGEGVREGIKEIKEIMGNYDKL
jgi:hypothetical protein